LPNYEAPAHSKGFFLVPILFVANSETILGFKPNWTPVFQTHLDTQHTCAISSNRLV